MDNTIAKLRTCLQKPTKTNWNKLVAVFSKWKGETELEVGMEYAMTHLEDWPDHLRSIPEKWVWDKKQGTVICSPLTTLCRSFYSLKDKALGADVLLSLAESPHFENIRLLDISGNLLGELGEEALLQSLNVLCSSPLFSGLKGLRLSDNGIGASGVEILAEAESLVELEELDLSGNLIGDKGLVALARGSQLHKLQRLSLSGCGASSWNLSRKGMIALVEEGALPSLRCLELRHSSIDSWAAAGMGHNFAHQTLESIDLRDNLIGSFGLASFVDARLKSLKQLDFRGQTLVDFDENDTEKLTVLEFYELTNNDKLTDRWEHMGHPEMFKIVARYLRRAHKKIKISL